MGSGPENWRMHGENTPGFAEYLLLAAAGGWGDAVVTDTLSVTFSDALIVLGMQNDHLPVDSMNPHGGTYATLEGHTIVPLVTDLMDHFARQGATVVVTRDYHPKDHCQFIDQLGPLPTNNLQGSVGSHLYRPVGECVQKLKRDKFTQDRCEVVFKGFHEDIDSASAFAYPEGSPDPIINKSSDDLCGGSSLYGWTGAFQLKCSNLEADVNAAPDLMSVHRRVPLPDLLRKRNVKRIFICGLGLDADVLETAMNARIAGFMETFMILDASRATHLSGMGTVGSGFLQDPAHLTAKVLASGAKLIPTAAVLPSLAPINPITASSKIKSGFPMKLGPFALVRARKISIYVDRKDGTYRAVAPLAEIRNLEKHKISPEGKIAASTPITLDAEARRNAGIPEDAVNFCWAYPLGEGNFVDGARAYFSTMSPSAAFFVYGGFMYFDKMGRVVSVNAISLGEGLNFTIPRPWPQQYTTALERRWSCVTAPFLRERGARLFCWINPGEVLTPALGGEKLSVSEHGAFVYLFNEDLYKGDERDCIFAISPEQVEDGEQLDVANIGRVGHEEDDMAALSELRTQMGLGEGNKKASSSVMQAFQEWDTDGSGTIKEDELAIAMKKLIPNMPDSAIRKLFKAADVNQDGVIEFGEFVKWIYQS